MGEDGGFHPCERFPLHPHRECGWAKAGGGEPSGVSLVSSRERSSGGTMSGDVMGAGMPVCLSVCLAVSLSAAQPSQGNRQQ